MEINTLQIFCSNITCYSFPLYFVIPACPAGYYGADCKQKCECEQGTCDRFRGCVCEGRHGARCERPGDNHWFQRNRPVFLRDLWAQSLSACDFFERHETCYRESERHRAQLGHHIRGQLLCVRPARSFTRWNNPGQAGQNHCLCESRLNNITVESSWGLMYWSRCVIHETPLLSFFSGSGHTDGKWSNDIRVQGGEDHRVGRWTLVVSSENQTQSGGERIHCECQRWDSSMFPKVLPAKVPNDHNTRCFRSLYGYEISNVHSGNIDCNYLTRQS